MPYAAPDSKFKILRAAGRSREGTLVPRDLMPLLASTYLPLVLVITYEIII